MTALEPSAACAALAVVLWDARDALEQVLFKVVEEQLILETRSRRWLAKADDELRGVALALRGREIERAVVAREAAEALGLDGGARLGVIAGAAPAPWAVVLDDHLVALRALVSDLDETTGHTRRLLSASTGAVTATADGLTRAERARRHDLPLDVVEHPETNRAMLVQAAAVTHAAALRTMAELLERSLRVFLG